MKIVRTAAFLAVCLGASTAAMAVTEYILPYNALPGACHQANDSKADNYGNTYNCAAEDSNDYTADVKAYAAATGAKFATANVADWSGGFGVRNQGEGLDVAEPNHAMDNAGYQEVLLFKFDDSFALSQFQLGWWQTDSDVSVLAYTGTGDAVADLLNSTETNLLGTGWDLVGNFENSGTNVKTFNTGVDAISSSYWIVTAYSKFGGNSNITDSDDYFKLKMIGGTFTCAGADDHDNDGAGSCAPPPPGVPEPASLALVGAALLGAFGGRRRALKAQKA